MRALSSSGRKILEGDREERRTALKSLANHQIGLSEEAKGDSLPHYLIAALLNH